jgi:hypothetical protein
MFFDMGLEASLISPFVVIEHGVIEVIDIRGRAVEASRACRRDDMSGVTCQEETAATHRFGDEASQGRVLFRSRGR